MAATTLGPWDLNPSQNLARIVSLQLLWTVFLEYSNMYRLDLLSAIIAGFLAVGFLVELFLFMEIVCMGHYGSLSFNHNDFFHC